MLLNTRTGGTVIRLCQLITATELATIFHEIYEQLAPQFGYATRPETKTFDANSPNGRLMIAVCDRVLMNETPPACAQIDA